MSALIGLGQGLGNMAQSLAQAMMMAQDRKAREKRDRTEQERWDSTFNLQRDQQKLANQQVTANLLSPGQTLTPEIVDYFKGSPFGALIRKQTALGAKGVGGAPDVTGGEEFTFWEGTNEQRQAAQDRRDASTQRAEEKAWREKVFGAQQSGEAMDRLFRRQLEEMGQRFTAGQNALNRQLQERLNPARVDPNAPEVLDRERSWMLMQALVANGSTPEQAMATVRMFQQMAGQMGKSTPGMSVDEKLAALDKY
jgi:hypothetical protein